MKEITGKEIIYRQPHKVCMLKVVKYHLPALDDAASKRLINSKWYAGYVSIPRGHKLFPIVNAVKKEMFRLSKRTPKHYRLDYDKLPVECHGGLTYMRKDIKNGKVGSITIGWDYNHAWDKTERINPDDILLECRDVVEQLLKERR